MSYENDIYTLAILKEITSLPKRAAIAAAKKAYRTVIQHTHQDSGQAAYNTFYSINSDSTSHPFVVANKGGFPTVGKRGDHRSDTGHTFVVAREKIKEFEAVAHMAKHINSITIYSTLRKDGDYAERAKLEGAFLMTENPGALDHEVGRVMTGSRF
jgi:hypothetical protein